MIGAYDNRESPQADHDGAMTLPLTTVRDALRDFPCGPGGHRFGPVVATVFRPNQLPLPVRACDRCKRLQNEETCSFCENRGDAGAFLLTGPREQMLIGPVCSDCLPGVTHPNETGWYAEAVRNP